MAESQTDCLILFSKLPAPGKCKTRLIPALGETGAASLAAAFLKDIAHRLAAANLGAHVRRVLCYDPPGAREALKTLLSEPKIILKEFSLLAQSGGDLGQRLAAAAQRVRKTCGGALVFVGADSPDLPLDVLVTALKHARESKAYIKYAHDGGYVCLALPPSALHTVFFDIDWSAPDTGRQQAARLRALGIPTHVSSSKWWDVDEPGDLPRLLARLEKCPPIAPLTLNALRKLS